MTEEQLRRFLGRVAFVPKTSCWAWRGATNAKGYAVFSRTEGSNFAHRAIHEHFGGSVPEGFTIDHLCRDRGCVNPFHLEAVPHRVNVLRGETLAAANAAKTHCPAGHEYNEQNSVRYNGNGGRQCLLCRKRNMAAYKARQRRQVAA